MKSIIIDASVILRSLNQSGASQTPDKLKKLLLDVKKKKVKLFSIVLLSLELANGLRFGFKNSVEADEVYSSFLALPIDIVPLSAVQMRDALSLSYRFNTTVYDTSYHLLAKLMNATFITCDREYYKKAGTWGSVELWT